MSDEGWIKLHRKILQWEWWDEPNTFRVFLWLLLKANHKDQNWRGLEIKRGQIVTSYDSVAKGTSLTNRKIRTIFDRLDGTELTRKTTNKYQIITITNYESYQQDDRQTTGKPSPERHSNDRQPTTNNNVNNDKNEKKVIADAKKPNSKGIRIPDDWKLTKELGEWAERQGMHEQDILKERDKFIDYWQSVAGAKGVKRDWSATWRNWIRQHLERKQNG